MRVRFTIRDLLWLTLVVALIVGWWVDRSNLAKKLADEQQTYHGPTSVAS
jgi:hypothetical protein